MRMAKRLVCLPLGASPLLLSMYHKPGSTRFAVTEGLDAEADAVGPGIYGGRVERDESGAVVIGQQFEEYNPIPGPLYAGGGYTELAQAIREGDVRRVAQLLDEQPDLVNDVLTGAASPLHLCGMAPRAGGAVTQLLCERGANLNARDSWGYTPLQRAATNDCVDAAKALLAAGASLEISSGVDGDGDNAYELAKRLRSYDCIFAFDDHIAAVNA